VDAVTLLAQPYAHRGLHRPNGPVENSLGAVEAAVKIGLGIEIDLRLSRDGVAVVHHDPTLLRVCRDPRRVSHLTAAELRRVRLHGSHETVPSAEDIFDAVDGRVPVLLDLKVGPSRRERERMAEEVARLVENRDVPVAAVSFDPLMLGAVADRCPSVGRGQSGGVGLNHTYRSAVLAALAHPVDALWFIRISRAQFVSYNVDRLPRRSVARARGHLPVVGWTLRCPRLLERVRPYIDGVIAEGDAVSALVS
jgi:glycerophosphoryl diester phosphodiesterase